MNFIRTYKLDYFLSVFLRGLTGLSTLYILKLLLLKVSKNDFELFNIIIGVFLFIAIFDISYNGVRNLYTEDFLNNNSRKLYSIIRSAFQVNIISGTITFLAMKIIFYFLEVRVSDFLLFSQIILINLKLITSFLQAKNENFITALLEFLFSVILISLFSINIGKGVEHILLYANSIYSAVLIFVWIHFILSNRRIRSENNSPMNEFKPSDIIKSGLNFSLPQFISLILPLALMYHFKVVVDEYQEFVIGYKFYGVLLTIYSISITPLWSKIYSLNITNSSSLKNVIKYFKILTYLFLFFSLSLILLNPILIEFFYGYEISWSINLLVFVIGFLQVLYVSIIMYYNGFNLTFMLSKKIFNFLKWYLPAGAIVFIFDHLNILYYSILALAILDLYLPFSYKWFRLIK